MEGYTLALDFPVSTKTLKLMKELDEITIDHNGRFYLAKDSRIDRETFFKSDKRIKNYKQARQALFTRDNFQSHQSERLGL